MAPQYLHVEVAAAQSPRQAGGVCGDFVDTLRTQAATVIACCDGLGHGIRAHVAARMCARRLTGLLEGGMSMRKAFARVVAGMNAIRGKEHTYAAFSLARILNDGTATVLAYESPAPIVISGGRRAEVLPVRTEVVERALIGESRIVLQPGDALLVMTDGITQAGLGRGLPEGWTERGVCEHVNACLTQAMGAGELPHRVHQRALELWGKPAGDDCTAVVASCRAGRTVTLFTGPPADRRSDAAAVERFLGEAGAKVVCGATTAEIVARHLGRPVTVEQNARSVLAPPRYGIDGIHLVTEGAVTLNQAVNIIDLPPAAYGEDSGVTELATLLRHADRVRILLGGTQNPAAGDIAFRQRGVLHRAQIVPLLADKLRQAGKLVVVVNL